MRILLTNDDGISSEGINLLAKALREAGHRVFIVAPDTDRSGSSNSICFLNDPCKLIEIEKDTWSCSGTPVDCVVIGLLGGVPEINLNGGEGSIPVDLVLSGINHGANMGTDIIYSGTAAAARQGSFLGIPSVALSLVENHGIWNWQPIIAYITEKLDEIRGFWRPGIFVNVNFPNNGKTPSALVQVFPSIRRYNDSIITYEAPRGGTYCFVKVGKTESTGEGGRPEDGSDWAEVLKNNAAYSLVISQPAAVSHT